MATVKMVALAQFIASKAGATGLTVTCDVDEYNVDSATVDNAFATAQSMTHVRNGIYRYFFDGDDTLLYVATAKTADSSVDQQHIPAVVVRLDRVNNADAKTSTRSTVTTAQVNTEVDTALADVGLTTTVTGRIDAAISTRNATTPLDSTATQAAAAAALTAYDTATGADVAGISVPTAAAIADAVWDETSADHTTVGSTGAALTAAGGAGDPWSVSTGTAYASDTFGGHVKSITPGAVTIVSPVATDGTSITLIRGDDYLNADNRALTFSGDSWPTLTGGAVALIVNVNGTPTSYTGTITGDGECYIELTDTQTSAITPGAYSYDLQATLSNGSIVTVVQGLLLVTADVR